MSVRAENYPVFKGSKENWKLDIYKKPSGMWTFSGNDRSEEENSLVSGIDTMLDQVLSAVGNFYLEIGEIEYTEDELPGCVQKISLELIRDGSEDVHNVRGSGNDYFCPELGIKGWLCPVLFDFFESAPDRFFVYAIQTEKSISTD